MANSNMKIRKGDIVIGWLIASLLVLRAGEYVIDYIIGDKNGKITTPVLSPGLSFLYSALIIALIFLVTLRILVALRVIQGFSSCYSFVTEKCSGVSDNTLRLSIFILAILVYTLQSYAFPLSPGRDYGTYLAYYFDYFSQEPVYHFLMLYRTPVTPLILGFSLQYGGALFLEALMAVGYALSIVAIYDIGLIWSRTIAMSSAILILLYPAYALLYHQASSEATFAFVCIFWWRYIAKTSSKPSIKKFIINGIIVFFMTLTRPIGQLGLVFVFFPFFLPKLAIYWRLKFAAAFLGTCISLLLLWSFHNYIRYDDFTVSRGSGAIIPFSRLFMRDKLIKPENGSHSLELYRAIETEILSKEPYKSYGITIESFHSPPKYCSRMWSDLISLSDRIWGWDSDYHKLRAVSIEAIKKYPYIFMKNMISDYYLAFNTHLRRNAPKKKDYTHLYEIIPKKFDEKGLPVPTEYQEIPRSYVGWHFSSPDNRMAPDPTSIELKFVPEQQKKVDALQDKIRTYVPNLPVKDGNARLALWFNKLLFYFPKIFYWMLLGVWGGIFLKKLRKRAFIFIFFITFMMVGVSYLAASWALIPHFRVPFDPIFIIGGLVTLMHLMTYGLKRVNLLRINDFFLK